MYNKRKAVLCSKASRLRRSLGRRRRETSFDKGFDDPVLLLVHLEVAFGHIFERNTVADDQVARIDLASLEVVVQDHVPVQMNGSLTITDDSDTLLHDGSDAAQNNQKMASM